MAAAAIRLVAAVALAALAVGCGGGGGGSVATSTGGERGPNAPGSAPADPPEPGPSPLQVAAGDYESDPEYAAAWGLQQVNAAIAYARIALRDGPGTAPGAGVRIAVIDNGIDGGHWEFDASRITESGDADPDRDHGTAVASIIAATRNGPVPDNPPELSNYDFHGIAWGIDHLEMYAIPLGRSDPNESYQAFPTGNVDDSVDRLAQQFSGLTGPADFVNMSFSVRGLVENYLNSRFGPLYASAIRTLAQPGVANGKTILVIAAGNAHGNKCESPEPNCVDGKLDASSPSLYAGLPALEQSLRSHAVAVVATDREGKIISFSNRCGVAAKWCIGAPGDRMPVAHYGTNERTGDKERGYAHASGTSLAAPYVTGGLAVLKHWFRTQLANEDLLARLYETAQVTPDPMPPGDSCPAHLDLDGNRSDCELSSALGRGLMDLDAATAPVGMVSFALGGKVAGGGPPAASSWLSPGRATGDAMSRSLAGREIALFDSLDAPFWTDADRFVREPAPPGLASRLSHWLAGIGRSGDGQPEDGVSFSLGPPAGAHTGLASQPAAAEARLGNTVLSTFASTGSAGESGARSVSGGAYGLEYAWKPKNGLADLRTGWVRETDALFGSGAEGAFGRLSSNLSFVGASGAFEAGGWRVAAGAEFGRARPDAGDGMLRVADGRAFSSAFAGEAIRHLGTGTLRVTLRQPLRVESGRLRLSLPVGRTPEGAVLRRQVPVDLEPSGRQIDFGINWTETLVPSSYWRVGAVVSHEPGHNAGNKPEAVVLAGLRVEL